MVTDSHSSYTARVNHIDQDVISSAVRLQTIFHFTLLTDPALGPVKAFCDTTYCWYVVI